MCVYNDRCEIVWQSIWIKQLVSIFHSPPSPYLFVMLFCFLAFTEIVSGSQPPHAFALHIQAEWRISMWVTYASLVQMMIYRPLDAKPFSNRWGIIVDKIFGNKHQWSLYTTPFLEEINWKCHLQNGDHFFGLLFLRSGNHTPIAWGHVDVSCGGCVVDICWTLGPVSI